jgi:outer membrane protein transport protein (OMPP1/FadL/TodX)
MSPLHWGCCQAACGADRSALTIRRVGSNSRTSGSPGRGAKLHGTADVDLQVRHFGPPAGPRAATNIAYLREEAPRGLGIDLAPEVRAGAWIAPDPWLRLELDLALALWSKADWDRPREIPLCGAPCRETLARDWHDTLSFRLGAECDITRHLRLAAGLGYEPSPVPMPTYTPYSNLEAFVPQGDAWVYAVGVTYSFSKLSFDVGYSLHDHRRRPDKFGGRYSSSSQVLAISTR